MSLLYLFHAAMGWTQRPLPVRQVFCGWATLPAPRGLFKQQESGVNDFDIKPEADVARAAYHCLVVTREWFVLAWAKKEPTWWSFLSLTKKIIKVWLLLVPVKMLGRKGAWVSCNQFSSEVSTWCRVRILGVGWQGLNSPSAACYLCSFQ